VNEKDLVGELDHVMRKKKENHAADYSSKKKESNTEGKGLSCLRI
jgi:hypothetical protein